jgi:trimeric autotransporter adhesin
VPSGDGGVRCWGLFFAWVPGQVQGLSSGVAAIALGASNHCAAVNGSAQCWGHNGGALGNNSTVDSSPPVQIQGLTTGVTAVAAGGGFACAIAGGTVQCWGYNASGRLGDNSYTDTLVPVRVQL